MKIAPGRLCVEGAQADRTGAKAVRVCVLQAGNSGAPTLIRGDVKVAIVNGNAQVKPGAGPDGLGHPHGRKRLPVIIRFAQQQRLIVGPQADVVPAVRIYTRRNLCRAHSHTRVSIVRFRKQQIVPKIGLKGIVLPRRIASHGKVTAAIGQHRDASVAVPPFSAY